MLFGSIFQKKFGKDPRELSIDKIEEISIKKKLKFREYANNLVSHRGNIFRMNKYDNLDKYIDESLKNPLIKLTK